MGLDSGDVGDCGVSKLVGLRCKKFQEFLLEIEIDLKRVSLINWLRLVLVLSAKMGVGGVGHMGNSRLLRSLPI